MKKTLRLRSAHASMKDGRTVVISGQRIFRLEKNGARVLFTNTRLESPKQKATIASTLNLLEGRRAA